MKKTPEDFNIKLYDKDKFKKTGILDCYQDVIFYNHDLTEIPFQFGVIVGTFHFGSNKLISLKGSPTEVKENFVCSDNLLTSLEYAPSKVGQSFYCQNNLLTSLKYSPDNVSESFNCSNNKLISLEYGPSNDIKGYFDCSENQLLSLKYSPSSVKKHFICSDNKLISLEGVSSKVSGNFYCSNNQLTSLEFLPQGVQILSLENNNFDINAWINILEKYPEKNNHCHIVPDNSSLERTLQGLKDKLEIIQMMKGA
jgi:hypothetical protein